MTDLKKGLTSEEARKRLEQNGVEVVRINPDKTGKINEDEFVTYRAVFASENVAFTNENLYYYFQHGSGIMADVAKKLNVSSVTVYNYYPSRRLLVDDAINESRKKMMEKLLGLQLIQVM